MYKEYFVFVFDDQTDADEFADEKDEELAKSL